MFVYFFEASYANLLPKASVVATCPIAGLRLPWWSFCGFRPTGEDTLLERDKEVPLDGSYTPPRNLTQIPKMMGFKRYLLSNIPILGIHISFRGCMPFGGWGS